MELDDEEEMDGFTEDRSDPLGLCDVIFLSISRKTAASRLLFSSLQVPQGSVCVNVPDDTPRPKNIRAFPPSVLSSTFLFWDFPASSKAIFTC